MSVHSGSENASRPEGSIRFIWRMADGQRSLFILCLIISAISGVLYLVPSWAVYRISDIVLSETAELAGVSELIWLALGASLTFAILTALTIYLGHRVAFMIQRELRQRLLSHLQRVPARDLEGRSGEMRKIILSDVDRLESLLAHILPNMAAGLATPVAALGLLLMVDWRMALASLVLLPVAWLAQRWTYRGADSLFADWGAAETRASSSLQSYVQGIVTLRAFNRQASSLSNLRDAVIRLRDLSAIISKRSRFTYSLFNICLATSLLVVLPFGLFLWQAGEITLAEFILFQLIGASVTAPLGKVVFAADIANRLADAVGRIKGILAMPLQRDEGQHNLPDQCGIRFENVGFEASNGQIILKDVTFEASAGETTVIVGLSGAGKTTLTQLLLRFADCTSGRILIVGRDITKLPLEKLRSLVSIVFQKSTLFQGTVSENIRMSEPEATHSQFESSVAAARVDRIEATGRDVLNCDVADKALNLSGGERQRVAIARALLKQAPILILDEATSAIDVENERAIQQALASLPSDRTLIIIGHRLSSLTHADRIVVLGPNGVEATGRHEDLMDRSATYRNLYETQKTAEGWKLGISDQASAHDTISGELTHA